MIQVTPWFQGPLSESAVFAIRNILILPGSDCSDMSLGMHFSIYIDLKNNRELEGTQRTGRYTLITVFFFIKNIQV